MHPGQTAMFKNPRTWATGAHGSYWWLTTGQDDLGSLLQACPQVVLGKYIAVTSFDSGPLALNQDEISAEWSSEGDIAYSPRIQSVEELARGECGGFDEWYIFDAPLNLGHVEPGNIFEADLKPGHLAVFVNYGGFGFHSAEHQALVDLFWPQLEWIRPGSYVADGDLLNFVTRDEDLFTVVVDALQPSGA